MSDVQIGSTVPMYGTRWTVFIAYVAGGVMAVSSRSVKLFATSGGAFTQGALRLNIDASLVATGMLWRASIGLSGGLAPAARAARTSVAVALHAVQAQGRAP